MGKRAPSAAAIPDRTMSLLSSGFSKSAICSTTKDETPPPTLLYDEKKVQYDKAKESNRLIHRQNDDYLMNAVAVLAGSKIREISTNHIL